MFSLQVRNSNRSQLKESASGSALLGRLLGFSAGIAVAVAADSYLMNHYFQQKILRNDWGVKSAIDRGLAMLQR